MPSPTSAAPSITLTPAPWTSEGVAFLRRVLAREVYTGSSGEALAMWAVGLQDRPRSSPGDSGDLARCLNVYWSAPASLRPKIRHQITVWSSVLKQEAGGVRGWRFGGDPDFETPRYLRPGDDLDDYWGRFENEDGSTPWCAASGCSERQDGRHSRWWDDYGTCSRDCAENYYGPEALDD